MNYITFPGESAYIFSAAWHFPCSVKWSSLWSSLVSLGGVKSPWVGTMTYHHRTRKLRWVHLSQSWHWECRTTEEENNHQSQEDRLRHYLLAMKNYRIKERLETSPTCLLSYRGIFSLQNDCLFVYPRLILSIQRCVPCQTLRLVAHANYHPRWPESHPPRAPCRWFKWDKEVKTG